MQSFTKQELLWVIGELDRAAVQMQNDLDTVKLSTIERGLTQLRMEQLISISDRLNKVVNDGDKRITITRPKTSLLQAKNLTVRKGDSIVNI